MKGEIREGKGGGERRGKGREMFGWTHYSFSFSSQLIVGLGSSISFIQKKKKKKKGA